MKRVLIALSALLFVNHVAADQAAVITALGVECTTASEYAKLAADGSDAACATCVKQDFITAYSDALATGDGKHPACCSNEADVVCRAMMTAFKKGCQTKGSHGIAGTCPSA